VDLLHARGIKGIASSKEVGDVVHVDASSNACFGVVSVTYHQASSRVSTNA
jgi:hypothetical protein